MELHSVPSRRSDPPPCNSQSPQGFLLAPNSSKEVGTLPHEHGGVWVFLLLSGWLSILFMQPAIQGNRTYGRGDGLSPEMISLGGQAQL